MERMYRDQARRGTRHQLLVRLLSVLLSASMALQGAPVAPAWAREADEPALELVVPADDREPAAEAEPADATTPDPAATEAEPELPKADAPEAAALPDEREPEAAPADEPVDVLQATAVPAEAAGAPDAAEAPLVEVPLACSVCFVGAGAQDFTITLTPADATGVPLEDAATTPCTKDDALAYDAARGYALSQRVPGTGEATPVSLPSVAFPAQGTFCYLLAEQPGDDARITYDDARYLITVDTANGAVQVGYQLLEEGSDTPQDLADEVPTFYNNGLVRVVGRSQGVAAPSEAQGFGACTAFQPEVRKVLRDGGLVGDDFTFGLYRDGTLLAEATNDANGLVQFDALTFDEGDLAGADEATLTYTIRERDDSATNQTIAYSDEVITLTVRLVLADGSLVATGSYLQDGVPTDTPTITNAYRDVAVHAVKRSGETGEPLAGATYGLWMLNPDGADVYMGAQVSDAQGDLWYQIPAQTDLTYYLKEESPAPAGHLVDPYPTDPFTLTTATEGDLTAFALAYAADDDAAPQLAQDAGDHVTLEYEPHQNPVADHVTRLAVNKLASDTHEYVAGAQLQILDEDGAVVAAWESGTEAYQVVALDVNAVYTLHEEAAPDGYTLADDVTFRLLSEDDHTTGELLSGATRYDDYQAAELVNAEFSALADDDGAQVFVIALYDAPLPTAEESVVHKQRQVERVRTVAGRTLLPQTDDPFDRTLCGALLAAGAGLLILGLVRRRRA